MKSVDSPCQAVLEVLRPGALTSVQDLGRRGYLSLGIAEAGAMDMGSLVAANRLAGNPDGCAGLEMAMAGPKLRFLAPVWFALAGADLSASLDGEPLEPGGARRAQAGQVLSFGSRQRGVFAYLALAGGLEAPLVLGSRSTYIYAGFGGHQGRVLAKGDVLRRLANPLPPSLDRLPSELDLPPDGPRQVRVILGPNQERFSPAGLETFLGQPYQVTFESNRMGYRLEGPVIEHAGSPIVVSECTPVGAVQVPGKGTPVLLLRERGTTGGYTKIACVITRDIDLVAQAPPGTEIRFEAVEVEEAQAMERQRWQALDAWRAPLDAPAID